MRCNITLRFYTDITYYLLLGMVQWEVKVSCGVAIPSTPFQQSNRPISVNTFPRKQIRKDENVSILGNLVLIKNIEKQSNRITK